MSLPMTLDVAQSLAQLADREILELQPLLPHASDSEHPKNLPTRPCSPFIPRTT